MALTELEYLFWFLLALGKVDYGLAEIAGWLKILPQFLENVLFGVTSLIIYEFDAQKTEEPTALVRFDPVMRGSALLAGNRLRFRYVIVKSNWHISKSHNRPVATVGPELCRYVSSLFLSKLIKAERNIPP